MIFYTGEEDDVMCIECKVVRHDLEDMDKPWTKHLEVSLEYLFVKLH